MHWLINSLLLLQPNAQKPTGNARFTSYPKLWMKNKPTFPRILINTCSFSGYFKFPVASKLFLDPWRVSASCCHASLTRRHKFWCLYVWRYREEKGGALAWIFRVFFHHQVKNTKESKCTIGAITNQTILIAAYYGFAREGGRGCMSECTCYKVVFSKAHLK